MAARVKRVLHIVQSLDTGGAERVVAEYALSHDRSRYIPEVCCVFEGGYLVPLLREAGVPVHLLERRARLDPSAFFRLIRLIASRRFDVVHNHTFSALAIGFPAALAAGANTLLRTEHNVMVRRRPLRRILSRMAALRESAQIAVSEAVRQSHIASSRIPAARFAVVRNGISDSRFGERDTREATRARLGIDCEAVVCLSVGSLTRQKDFANLLTSAAVVARELPDTVFLIAGEGPQREILEGRCQELGLEGSVRFLGRVTDVPALLAASDIFVLSSAWEGLPITVLEAMAAGVPCVSTRVGGVPEVLEDGRTGIIVDTGEPAALAGGILSLARDPELRRALSSRARERYERSFTAAGMVGETEAIYDLASVGRADLAAAGPIKVLYVIGQLSFGGAERQVAELATRLPRDRYEPVVCCLSGRGPLADEFEQAGVHVVCIGKRAGIFSGASLALARLVGSERPVIVHSYLFSANLRALLIGRLARVPMVVTSYRNVDIHGRLLFNALERLLSSLNDRVIANAEAVRDYVSRAHAIRRDKIKVILNGVAFDRVSQLSAPTGGESGGRRPSGPPTVLVIASLTRKKDHNTLLEAAAHVTGNVPEARFILVGDGPLRGELEARTRELGITDNVEFRGETSDVAAAFHEACVCALTSLKEGCSNFILESMVAGKPVVATDAGGNRELIVDGETGYVVAQGDFRALAERLTALLTDPDLTRRMGESGSERARKCFGVDRMVGETVEFYEETLRERIPGIVEWAYARAARLGEGA